MKYCTCKEPLTFNKYRRGWCFMCSLYIRTNKQIKASKQAKAQLRDECGRFTKNIKSDSMKWNYQTILIRLTRIEKLLVDIDEKITRAFGGGGGGGIGFNY